MRAPRRAGFVQRHMPPAGGFITLLLCATFAALLLTFGVQMVGPADAAVTVNGHDSATSEAFHLVPGTYEMQWSTHDNTCGDTNAHAGALEVDLIPGDRSDSVFQGQPLHRTLIDPSFSVGTARNGRDDFDVFQAGYYKVVVTSCGDWHLAIRQQH